MCHNCHVHASLQMPCSCPEPSSHRFVICSTSTLQQSSCCNPISKLAMVGHAGGCAPTKKACANCTCGRAEAEAAGVKVKLTQDMVENPQSACGSVRSPVVCLIVFVVQTPGTRHGNCASDGRSINGLLGSLCFHCLTASHFGLLKRSHSSAHAVWLGGCVSLRNMPVQGPALLPAWQEDRDTCRLLGRRRVAGRTMSGRHSSRVGVGHELSVCRWDSCAACRSAL